MEAEGLAQGGAGHRRLLAELRYDCCPSDKAPTVSHSQYYSNPDRKYPAFAPHLQTSLPSSRPCQQQEELCFPLPQLTSHMPVFTHQEGQHETLTCCTAETESTASLAAFPAYRLAAACETLE